PLPPSSCVACACSMFSPCPRYCAASWSPEPLSRFKPSCGQATGTQVPHGRVDRRRRVLLAIGRGDVPDVVVAIPRTTRRRERMVDAEIHAADARKAARQVERLADNLLL